MDVQWPLVFFTLLSGLGVGAFAFVAVNEWLGKAEGTRLPGAITALVALIAGAVASFFHLGHPERLFNALGHVGSGIMLEMSLMGLAGLAMLLYILALRLGYSTQARKTLATIGLVLAVALVLVQGFSYVLPSRPAWNTWLLPLLYAASAAVLGLFAMYVWTALGVKAKEEAVAVLDVNRATFFALVAEAVVLAAYVAHVAVAPFPDPLRSVARLAGGDLAVAFWAGVVIVGLAIPLVLTALLLKAKVERLAGFRGLAVAVAGLVCVLIGGTATRALMYILGSSVLRF